jgi:hypothetical protein
MVLIFKQGKWLNMELPLPVDPLWSKDDCMVYANVVAFFEDKTPKEAAQLAESYVYKKLLGVRYTKATEAQLARVGTT